MTTTIKLRYCLINLLVISLLACTPPQADRPDRSPGAYIPLLKNTHAGEFTATNWVRGVNGSYLEIRASGEDAWHALNQALANLGIKPLRKDPAAAGWLTDWIVWKYDKATGKAQSKPGISMKTQSLERHRFLFTLAPGDSADRVKIMATDTARQREVDIAPDSEYSWLEWQEKDPQQVAADTFLQRLQLPIESALATRFVVSGEIVKGKDGVAVVDETASRTEADVVLITVPEVDLTTETMPVREVQTPERRSTAETTTTVPDSRVVAIPPSTESPAPTYVAKQRVIRKDAISPNEAITARKDISVRAATKSALAPPVQTPEKTATTAPVPVPDFLDLGSEEPRETAASESAQVITGQPVAVPEPATNGLLVHAAPGATWTALLVSLKDLDIAVEHIDERQHALLTGWVDANYDVKNQLLVMQSKEKPLWAFNLDGQGVERHRFQVVVAPANQGTRSIIYAYHTGTQEQVDLTPDSEQTLLSWEDRDISADVALALLRRLRIIVPH